jgi:hypothetical protein
MGAGIGQETLEMLIKWLYKNPDADEHIEVWVDKEGFMLGLMAVNGCTYEEALAEWESLEDGDAE